MRHARIDRWSRLDSPVHRLHPVAKVVAALGMLVAIATMSRPTWPLAAIYLAMLATGVFAARLPIVRLLIGATVVLPFACAIGFVSILSGDPNRAVMLVVRGYLSSLTALLLVASTPLPELLGGLDRLGAPAFLLQVMQFLYRYLMVLREEAGAMRDAAASRSGSVRVLEFKKAAGAAGVLFARAHTRASAIHRAMVARGFDGRMPAFRPTPLRLPDVIFAAASVCTVVAARVALK